jgi:hypothetical protein
MDVTSGEIIINCSYAIGLVQIVTKANLVCDTILHFFYNKSSHSINLNIS